MEVNSKQVWEINLQVCGQTQKEMGGIDSNSVQDKYINSSRCWTPCTQYSDLCLFTPTIKCIILHYTIDTSITSLGSSFSAPKTKIPADKCLSWYFCNQCYIFIGNNWSTDSIAQPIENGQQYCSFLSQIDQWMKGSRSPRNKGYNPYYPCFMRQELLTELNDPNTINWFVF